MAMIALRVPQDAARLLNRIAYNTPGNNQAASDMHITIISLGDGIPVSTLAKVMSVCYEITSNTAPFTVTVDRIDSFKPGQDGTPIIMPILSDEIHKLEQVLKAKLDENQIEYSKKFPEFKPHVTLSYVDGMRGAGMLSSPLSWGVYELTIYGGDHGDSGLSIVLPFEVSSHQVKIDVATRIAGKWAQSIRDGVLQVANRYGGQSLPTVTLIDVGMTDNGVTQKWGVYSNGQKVVVDSIIDENGNIEIGGQDLNIGTITAQQAVAFILHGAHPRYYPKPGRVVELDDVFIQGANKKFSV